MPGYRVHITVAVILYGVLVLFLGGMIGNWQILCGGLVALCAGALFPDIDIKSKGQHYLYRIYAITLFGILALYWFHGTQVWIDLIICLAVVTIAPMLARHRGITHSPPFILALGSAAWVISAGLYPAYTASLFFYCLCFVLGAFSHVWLDKRRIYFYR